MESTKRTEQEKYAVVPSSTQPRPRSWHAQLAGRFGNSREDFPPPSMTGTLSLHALIISYCIPRHYLFIPMMNFSHKFFILILIIMYMEQGSS